MNFDRNTILGFLLLGGLFFGYFYFTNQEQAKYKKKQAAELRIKDSIANANRLPIDTAQLAKDAVRNDSLNQLTKAGSFKDAAKGNEQIVQVENEVFTVGFSTKGGQPKWVNLKNYKHKDSSLVTLAGTRFDNIGYTINTGSGTAQTSDLYFQPGVVVKNADGSQTISFSLTGADSSSTNITHQYTIKKTDYLIDFSAKLKGADQLLTQGNLNLTWNYAAAQQEPTLSYEKENTQIGYIENGDFDYHTIHRRTSVTFDEKVKWLGVRQRFFYSILVSKNEFASGKMNWEVPSDTNVVVQTTSDMKVQLPVASSANADFSLYFGPSDYHILKNYDLGFEKLVNLGQGMYAFVRPINKYLIMPVFDFIYNNIGNAGMAILLLTIIIRLLTSPLMYPGYKTSAQMKLLRPDLAKLKEKHPDQKQYAMEQMKFMREAGVNQFAGCLPGLLQIPIFFSLYSFFNANIDLRGQNFLWAQDLSAYDVIFKFGFNIPLLGEHLSLFTITACLTSFLISYFSMSMTADQSNPVLKYLPFIFPIFLLFIFNRLPSALTWYYTVSNIITLGIQFFIQRYVLNHDKLLTRMEENRKKPKTKSKWQERVEQMQEQQKKLKEMQQKGKK